MEIVEILKQVLLEFTSGAVSLAKASIVVLVGWLLAKAIMKALEKVFTGLNLDRYGEKINETEFAQKAGLKLKLSIFLSRLAYYVLMLVFIMMATDVLGVPIVSAMVKDLISYLPKLLASVALFVFGIYLAEFVKNIVQAATNALGISSGKIIANFVFYLIFITLTISALAQASIETSLITSNLTVILGGVILAFAIGYGFASRDTMANFLASFYSKNKVKIGDYIAIDGSRGKVISMDNSSVTLQGDGKITIIPLKKLTSEKVEIFTSDRHLG